MLGRIYEGDYLTLQHSKYIRVSCGPHGFRDFLSFLQYTSMGAIGCHSNNSFGQTSQKT